MDDLIEKVALMLAASSPVTKVCIDYLPESPDECAGLFCWDRRNADQDDGTSTRFVQLRVRSSSYETAMQKCQAMAVMLESGADETPLRVDWPGTVIGRVRRGPILYSREDSRVTVYSELTLWGRN